MEIQNLVAIHESLHYLVKSNSVEYLQNSYFSFQKKAGSLLFLASPLFKKLQEIFKFSLFLTKRTFFLNENLVVLMKMVYIHTSGMILGHLKFERNMLTRFWDISTIYLNILALGAERITAASSLIKDGISASQVLILYSSCQTVHTNKKATFQKWLAEKSLEESTWCKNQQNSNKDKSVFLFKTSELQIRKDGEGSFVSII